MKSWMRNQNLAILGSPFMYPMEKRATRRPMTLTTQAMTTFRGSTNTPISKGIHGNRQSTTLPARMSGIIDRENRALNPIDAMATWLLRLELVLESKGVSTDPMNGRIHASHGAYGSNTLSSYDPPLLGVDLVLDRLKSMIISSRLVYANSYSVVVSMAFVGQMSTHSPQKIHRSRRYVISASFSFPITSMASEGQI